MSVDRILVSWEEVESLTGRLAHLIKAAGQDYDVLLGIARGGMFPALLLAQVLEHGMTLTCHLKRYQQGATESEVNPRIAAFPSRTQLERKRVLLIDEVWDRGDSIIRARQEAELHEPLLVHTAVLHFKPSRNRYQGSQPDYFVEKADVWLVYPWEAFHAAHLQATS